MLLRELLRNRPSGVTQRDAETLALHVLGRDRAFLYAQPNAELTSLQAEALGALFARRARHEPLQYLIGHQEFFGLDLLVTPAVLIPRPETEHLVEAALAWAQTQPGALHLVDVGTGSGALALALAAHLPEARITALDLSEAALAVAQANAERLGLKTRVRFLKSDLLGVFQAELQTRMRVDAIVSNPPYVPLGDAMGLAPEVRDFEPSIALFAGTDGTDNYQRLLPEAAALLRPDGLLALEFGYGQRPLLDDLFRAQSPEIWNTPRFTNDLQGIPRVLITTRKGESIDRDAPPWRG